MSTPRDRIEAKLGLAGPPFHHVRDAPPRVPDHELVRRIGQGSYGEVWLARNALGTWRAVKIVYRDNFKDARPYEREFAGIRRFEPLSRADEGFVDILQVGRDDAEGWFYYVMELADDVTLVFQPATTDDSNIGGTTSVPAPPTGKSALQPAIYKPRTLSHDLHQRMRLPLEDCLQLGLTLSLALGHLHRHGLIHRDIKPSNIIFVGGVPKLADIGLVTDAAGANTFVGTEGFVPPEGPTSPQADIYALGKVLYEAAMGKDRNEFPEPFTQISTDRESVALMELNVILLRACAPSPKARYVTAEEMHADLALLHSGGSVKRRHQFERRFRIAQRVGAIAAAVALVAGTAWFWQQQQTGKMARLATEKASLATEKAKLADNLARTGEENRERIVRLNIANGIRTLDEGDSAGALLWFANALPLVTNKPAEESIHRTRIQQTLDQTPRVLRVLPHESSLCSSAFSPDGQFIATGTRGGNLRVWNPADGALVWGPKRMGAEPLFVRFSRDGQRLFACSSVQQWMFRGYVLERNFFAVLDAASGREIFPAGEALPGMSTNLICSSFSPDDRWLAVSSKDNVIRLLDLENGRSLTELRGHTNEVSFLSFSADGSLLASASLDRTVRVWRLPSGEPAGSPLEHRFPCYRAVLTDDGQHLITGAFASPDEWGIREGEVQAWDVSTSQRLGNPIKARDWIAMFVAPARQGRFFVQDGIREGLHAYNFESPAEAPARLEMGGIQCWAFSKDGNRLALGNGDYMTRIFDAQTGAPLEGPFRHPCSEITAIQFSPDEQRLLTASGDGNARLWDLRPAPTESARLKLPAPFKLVHTKNLGRQLGRSPGGTPISLEDGTVRIISDQLQELHRFTSEEAGTTVESPTSARHSEMWALYAAGVGNHTAVILCRQDGEQVRQFTLQHPDLIHWQVFSFDDRYVLSYCMDRLVRFWRTSDGQVERTVEVPKSADGDLIALSPDGRTALWRQSALPGASPVYSVQFLDLETGKFIGRVLELPGTIMSSPFSPDGKQMAFMDSGGPVTVVEARTGRMISSAIKHSSNLNWLQWDPDGRRLLTAGPNDEVLVWDVETGTQLLGPLRMPGGIIRFARWSPDGRFIVTRSDDKKVRVWDAATGEAVTPPLKQAGYVNFAFMTRSNRVITANLPDLLCAWDLKETTLPPDILADYAKLLSGRYLNAAGVMLALKPEELAELDCSLRTRAPQLFE